MLSPLLVPAAAGIMACRRKHRRQIPCRLGRVPADISRDSGKFLIWLHALSAGEVNAASPLLEAIRERWPQAALLCSASTSSGLALMKKKAQQIDAQALTCLPLDLPPLTSYVIGRIKPDCFILTETDIWPDFIWRLREHGIPAILANGSISSRAARRLMSLEQKGIEAARFFYGGFHTVAMQSDHDLERLSRLSELSNITSCGNLKYDISLPEIDQAWQDSMRQELHIESGDFIIVAGSTHPGEEELLASCLEKLSMKTGQRLRFIIAPRDPARARQVAEIFTSRGIGTTLRSSQQDSRGAQVIILDTLGELAHFYSLGNVAFVGGSLVPTGGHNLFEPALHKIPVLYGPHIESCMDMSELLIQHGGGKMVNSADELAETISRLHDLPDLLKEMGDRAAECVNRQRGASQRYVSLIEDALFQKKK